MSHKSKSNYSESVPDNLSHKSHRLAAASQGLATRQYVFPRQILLFQMQSQKFHQLQRQSFGIVTKIDCAAVPNSASVPKTFFRQKSFSQSHEQVLKIQISYYCKFVFQGLNKFGLNSPKNSLSVELWINRYHSTEEGIFSINANYISLTEN